MFHILRATGKFTLLNGFNILASAFLLWNKPYLFSKKLDTRKWDTGAKTPLILIPILFLLFLDAPRELLKNATSGYPNVGTEKCF